MKVWCIDMRVLLFATLLLLFEPYSVQAEKLFPPSWPWHGVSMGSLSSSPADLDRFFGELHFNMVRLQLKPAKLAKRHHMSPQVAWRESLAWLDSMLDQCRLLGVKAIVDISYFPIDPNYNPNSDIRIPQYTQSFWNDPRRLDDVVNTVHRLASHLKERGEELAAFSVMSEPAIRRGWKLEAPRRWASLMKRVVTAIRAERRGAWILISAPPLAKPSSYSGFQPFDMKRIIYDAHMYLPSEFTAQGIRGKKVGLKYPGRIHGTIWNREKLRMALAPLREFQQKHPGAVFVGEFSAVRWAKGGEQYIRDLVSIFDEFSWGWAYFSATGWHGWNPDYNHSYGDNKQARKQFVGEKSIRWQTLRQIFDVERAKRP